MANICEHMFKNEDSKNKGYSHMEFDLIAKMHASIRKNLKTGQYEIYHRPSKKVWYTGDLAYIVGQANMLENQTWITLECGMMCPEKRADQAFAGTGAGGGR